jgi:hypothetical protein
VTAVNLDSYEGPPPLNIGNFRAYVKAEGDLRNYPPQCAPTVIDSENKALKGIQEALGDGDGINCDCCSRCGDNCDTCDVNQCGQILRGEVMEDFCRGCCYPYGPQQAQCCRVLSGNYGKIVRLYEVYPRVIDTVSQPITIYGHGFDNNARLNKVKVGGKSCPVLDVDVSTVTLDGNLTCLAPSGFGKDVMPIIIR